MLGCIFFRTHISEAQGLYDINIEYTYDPFFQEAYLRVYPPYGPPPTMVGPSWGYTSDYSYKESLITPLIEFEHMMDLLINETWRLPYPKRFDIIDPYMIFPNAYTGVYDLNTSFMNANPMFLDGISLSNTTMTKLTLVGFPFNTGGYIFQGNLNYIYGNQYIPPVQVGSTYLIPYVNIPGFIANMELTYLLVARDTLLQSYNPWLAPLAATGF